MKKLKYWRDYFKMVEKRYGKNIEVYIMTEDGEKRNMLQTIIHDGDKTTLYLKAVRM